MVVPETVTVPSTIKPSLILIVDESAALKVVPKNDIPSTATLPDPFAEICRSAFEAFDAIVLSFIVTRSILDCPVTVCVPVVVIAAVVSVPLTLIVPLTSISVAVKSISSVAPIDNTVALDP